MLLPPLRKEDLDAIEALLPPQVRRMDWRWRVCDLEPLVALAAWRSLSIEARAEAMVDALLLEFSVRADP